MRRERFDRLALAARGIGNVIDERRTRDLHLDRPCEDPLGMPSPAPGSSENIAL